MITSEKHAQSMDSPSQKLETHDHMLICELAKDLAPYKIAKKFEISLDEVKSICSKYGVRVIGKHKPSTMKMRILELKAKGWRQIDIARELNTDDSTVRKYLWEAGIKSGKASERSAESVKKAKQVELLRRDGMSAQDACNAVGTTLNSYYLYREKKALQLAGRNTTGWRVEWVNM